MFSISSHPNILRTISYDYYYFVMNVMKNDSYFRFRLGEGLELMIRCIKEQKYASGTDMLFIQLP